MSSPERKSEMTSSQRAMLVSCALILVAAAIYYFGVRSVAKAIRSSREDFVQLTAEQASVQRDLRDSHPARTRRAALEKAREPFMGALLTPLLGSWSMRAKAILDPLAADVGLKNADYTELPVRALPLPDPVPVQLYARQPIRVTCRGSYAEIASFVMRVEKMLPYVSLEALTIKAQQDPAVQQGVLVFEWPVKGALSRTAPAKGGVQ